MASDWSSVADQAEESPARRGCKRLGSLAAIGADDVGVEDRRPGSSEPAGDVDEVVAVGVALADLGRAGGELLPGLGRPSTES